MFSIALYHINSFLELLLWSNLPTMKGILFLLLTLGAAFASACHNYYSCQCVNSDGTPNNAATNNVCNAVGGNGNGLCYGGGGYG
jgi:hypothetical protein